MPIYSAQLDITFEAADDRGALLTAYAHALYIPQSSCHKVVVNRADGSHFDEPIGPTIDIISDLLSGSVPVGTNSDGNGSIADLVRNNGTTKGLRRRNRK